MKKPQQDDAEQNVVAPDGEICSLEMRRRTEACMTSIHEQRASAGYRNLQLSAVPTDILTLKNVMWIDLSHNQITRFPGTVVANELLKLEVLHLQHNLLYVLEDLLALSTCPRLRELNMANNPLRLLPNRIYLLEALFTSPACPSKALGMIYQDDELKRHGPSSKMTYQAKLPRLCGFPILLKLNDDWITDDQVMQVEKEWEKPMDYYKIPTKSYQMPLRIDVMRSKKKKAKEEVRFDGSRMTMEQLMRREARSIAIPQATVIKHVQVDVESGNEVVEEPTEEEGEETKDDPDLVHRLFQLSKKKDDKTMATTPVTAEKQEEEDDEERWNYPISTFDRLGSEERHYVRMKSKQTALAIERDDQFFTSSIFLDCVAQSEKSRRLTVRAVDVLTSSASEPELPVSSATANLLQNLSTKFSRQLDHESYEKIEAFRAKQITVNSANMTADVSDFYQSEHQAQRQKTNQLLRSQSHASIVKKRSLEDDLEESMSKLKLKNAIDLANSLMDHKQERRMIQMLIEADQKVIEEERIAQEQISHKHRLRLIEKRQMHTQSQAQVDAMVRKVTRNHTSPWQERNWTAKEIQRNNKRRQSLATENPSPRRRKSPSKSKDHSSVASSAACSSGIKAMDLFRTIETVDKAASDPLAHVNSHDLLVRCSEIRQNADKHIKGLQQHRDRFLEDEAAWEQMRHDPINVVRRHLRRRLYQDAQEIQIGSTQYFYSSLFN